MEPSVPTEYVGRLLAQLHATTPPRDILTQSVMALAAGRMCFEAMP